MPYFPAMCVSTLCVVIAKFGSIVQMLIGILSILALVVFIWGIVKYVASAGDADKAKEGKSIMIYGVIALFVLFSVWGLVNFLRSEFLINNGTPVSPPYVDL